MYNYILERDRYVVYFWKLSFNFLVEKFGDHDRIVILRTNHNDRHMEITITKKFIIFNSYKRKIQLSHEIDFENTKINILITSLPNKGTLAINDNVYELKELLCTGKFTEINSTIPINDPNINYINFNSTIPRVYGDCFTNLHTHKMFGEYLIEQGANYYCVNYPAVCDCKIILDCIREDIKRCWPSKVYIFMKSHLRYLRPLYKELVEEYPTIEFIRCTMPHPQPEQNKRYNDNVRKGLTKYIDFAKDFDDIADISEYFVDEAHLNENGAKIIVERIKKEAPDLLVHYDLQE